MSFILDALKRSENARQRRLGPSLADAPLTRRRGERPWWAFALAALLVLNLGVLIVAMARKPGPAQPIEVAAPNPAQAPHSTAPAPVGSNLDGALAQTRPPPPAIGPATRSLADEAEMLRPMDIEREDDSTPPPFALAAAAAVPQRPPIVRPIEAPGSRTAPMPAAANSATLEEILPTHSELVAGGMSLPDMHLDIHVHSPNAAERFVFVNMRKYVEGQTLREGPSLERITPEGVILNHQGLRFLLPRH